MADKSYLKRQIRLVSLNASDFFTDEEYAMYMELCKLSNEIDKVESDKSKILLQKTLIDEKKATSKKFAQLIAKHKGTPRSVRLASVLKIGSEMTGATYKRLKISRRICEFESEMSRAMGLKHLDSTFDKIIVKWKNEDLLEQLVIDGFTFSILQPDGTVENRKYRCFTASAGQLRRDKVQFISESIWQKIKPRIECGLDWDEINARGGLNCNKYMAYLALPCSATDEWADFDIDRCIVIPDWEGEVTGRMLYIKDDYSTEDGIRTVKINHVDGAGMMLPCVSTVNFMTRGPYMKGLLCVFDYLAFCKVHGIERPVIKDRWGLEHDLIAEDIRIIFTESMFKLAKLYRSFDEYKTAFKANGCRFGKTNTEEEYLPDKNFNYQMTQTLVDFTDEEIAEFCGKTHRKLKNLVVNKESMLQVLKASSSSKNSFCRALRMYPELLRDGYARKQLKDTKKRMLYDAKSGAIKINNKRLFAIPDWYAACQYYFLGIEKPEGLLQNGEIACKPYRGTPVVDVLRSPHLYMEHCLEKVVNDDEIYRWFVTDGIYTSCHDLISRILQFDVDGDQLNVVAEPVILKVAERNLKKFDVIPLFYDAGKAPPEPITKQALFHGLKRAHEGSNIGTISNMLTRLWNRDSPDRLAAALITRKNNAIIDYAKTGYLVDWTDNKELTKRINRATGGSHGKMPWFFKYSKNGRAADKREKHTYAKSNNSTMNRICAFFDDIGNINMNMAEVPAFNVQMLLSEPLKKLNNNIVQTFCDLDSMQISIDIILSETSPSECNAAGMYEMLAEEYTNILIEKFGSIEACYPHIASFLFSGEHLKSNSHKRMFWRIFGDIALTNLENNLRSNEVCQFCGAKVPSWADTHVCPKNIQGFYVCCDCGQLCSRTNSKQKRCENCQKKWNALSHRNRSAKQRERQKEYEKKCITFLQSCWNKTS